LKLTKKQKRAGVLGLSAAICIQRHLKPSQSIVIVARDFPNATSINYATAWAGAHYRPVPGKTPQLIQEAAWAKRAYEVFQRIATDEPGAGVQFMPAVEYFENPPQEYLDAIADLSNGAYAHIASSFHRLSPAESGDDDAIKFGIRYWTYCVNSPVYCAHLLRKFILKGGQTLEYTLVSLQEAFSLAKNATTVVNCSGVGFADPNSYIIRGLPSCSPGMNLRGILRL
jgi:D-amino-acid oxidase